MIISTKHLTLKKKSMALTSYKVSAPGSIMLMGEHAVLHGYAAIVCAIPHRVTITLTMREDNKIVIDSTTFGQYQTDINKIVIKKPYQFVLTAIQRFSKKIPCGLTLIIESDISHQMGLGSSSAVTVAIIGALKAWLDLSIDVFKASKEVVVKLQGKASGADVAASVYGGTLFYRAAPFAYEHLPYPPPLTLVYSGSKMPTPEVIAIVEANRIKNPNGFDSIFKAMENCTQRARIAIIEQDWQGLGKICNIAQDLMVAMGVSNPKLPLNLALYYRFY